MTSACHLWPHSRYAVAALAVGAALTVGACSGEPVSSGVATLPSVAATQRPGATTTPDTPTPSGAGSFAALVAYAACMRSHGVPNFPDPMQRNGFIGFRIQGMNMNAPTFVAADQTCKRLLRAGPASGGAHAGTNSQRAVEWAACIRAHGEPNFPDPTFADGQAQVDLTGTGITADAPQFTAAMKACASLEVPVAFSKRGP